MSSLLFSLLHQCDLLRRQVVKLVDQGVDLAVGGGNLAGDDLALGRSGGGSQIEERTILWQYINEMGLKVVFFMPFVNH